jgi:3-oxoacyl-(acyl-carrier-protein) synthase
LSKIISITALVSISPLGNDQKTIWENYKNADHCFTSHFLDHKQTLVAQLDDHSKAIIEDLKDSDIKYKSLDKSVLYAMAASRKAMETQVGLPMMFLESILVPLVARLIYSKNIFKNI